VGGAGGGGAGGGGGGGPGGGGGGGGGARGEPSMFISVGWDREGVSLEGGRYDIACVCKVPSNREVFFVVCVVWLGSCMERV
jgi:hypothetical protein